MISPNSYLLKKEREFCVARARAGWGKGNFPISKYIYPSFRLRFPAKFKIRKIFLSFFSKIPPARKKEKEWKIFRFLKPAAGWRGSQAHTKKSKVFLEKSSSLVVNVVPKSNFPVFRDFFFGDFRENCHWFLSDFPVALETFLAARVRFASRAIFKEILSRICFARNKKNFCVFCCCDILNLHQLQKKSFLMAVSEQSKIS